jgi:hypothetical protein
MNNLDDVKGFLDVKWCEKLIDKSMRLYIVLDN